MTEWNLSLCWIPEQGKLSDVAEDGSTGEVSLQSQMCTDSNLPTETHDMLHPSTDEGNPITRATPAYSVTLTQSDNVATAKIS